VGERDDVLDRYYQCALLHNVDPIIRVSADCPLLDPRLVNDILRFYSKHNYDYVSNTLNPTYPDVLHIEIFSLKTLKKFGSMQN